MFQPPRVSCPTSLPLPLRCFRHGAHCGTGDTAAIPHTAAPVPRLPGAWRMWGGDRRVVSRRVAACALPPNRRWGITVPPCAGAGCRRRWRRRRAAARTATAQLSACCRASSAPGAFFSGSCRGLPVWFTRPRPPSPILQLQWQAAEGQKLCVRAMMVWCRGKGVVGPERSACVYRWLFKERVRRTGLA